MLDPTSTTLEGPDDSINVNFSEATTEQRLQCCKLAAMAFGAPLSETDYVEREEYLSQRPLARDKGCASGVSLWPRIQLEFLQLARQYTEIFSFDI
jgi:hypothetical protein